MYILVRHFIRRYLIPPLPKLIISGTTNSNDFAKGMWL
jgi:hypothetical protein